jgi:hypothetical protein
MSVCLGASNMSDVDVRTVGLGVLLFGVGTALVFGPDTFGAAVPVALVALGALALAAGEVPADVTEGRPPV